MELDLKRPRLTARLPVTACEPEFLQEVKAFAEENGVTASEVVRASLRFFLDRKFGSAEDKLSKTHKKRAKRTKRAKVVAS